MRPTNSVLAIVSLEDLCLDEQKAMKVWVKQEQGFGSTH